MYCRVYYPIMLVCIWLCSQPGCAVFDPVERIAQRDFFSANYVDQSSIDSLKKTYSIHYDTVKAELVELQKLMETHPDRATIIVEKINDHKQYLYTMENYLFLCPSHKTEEIESVEKKCKSCSGRGKSLFSSQICNNCTGTGKISFMAKLTKKCAICKQYYRGSLKGTDLYVHQ